MSAWADWIVMWYRVASHHGRNSFAQRATELRTGVAYHTWARELEAFEKARVEAKP